MDKLTVEEKQILKAKGILNQKQEEFYAIRFLSKVGYFKAEEMIALSEIAKEYGNGELSLTSRLTVEIPYIKEENIDKVVEISRKKGLRIGGAGKTVRAIIVTCKGTVCKHGLIDTRKIGELFEEKFLGRKVPAKFKIGVFGCINSYGKAQSNDFGIIPIMNSESKEVEFLVFIGGRAGRKARKAEPMKKRFKEEELLKLLECTIDYYNELAGEKERLAEIIERIGEEEFEKNIIKRFNA
ncbi:nitrite reductase [Clostridium perfringens]|uniref:nitrite reductase n=1 Tax=Clostridium perfringens TaxID=1502 RepID=UPI0039E75E59